MQLPRSKRIFAQAAFGLSLAGGATALGILSAPGPTPPHVAEGRDGLNLTAPPSPAHALSQPFAPRTASVGAPFVGPVTPPQGAGGYSGYRQAILEMGGGLREFYFTRGIYSSWSRGYRRGGSWATDYPKADRQFLWGLKRLTNIDAYDFENAVLLTDPDLRRYPFLYMLEVGRMQLTPAEVEGLRDYLAAGGFLFIDDFWGTYEWENFEWEIHKVLPGSQIVELPADHPLFSSFYQIDEVLQVPNVGNAARGITWEQDGYVAHVRAIFDDNDRLIVLINWNTDLGDAWEWAEDPFYPLTYSNYAYQMAVNAIVYAMSH